MSLAVLADHMASKGRGPDSMLIHMSPREVQGLQALAMKHGGSLTINPETGLPEAGFLDKLLPTIIGAGLTFFGGVPPHIAAMMVGGVETVRTGDLGRGISAGLGAYGGANLTAGLTEAGASTIGAAEAAKGLTMTPELAAELQIAGEGAKDTLLQQQVADKIAAATPYEKLSSGFDAFKNNPTGMAKSLAMPAAMAFGPAIMAGANVQAKGPQTVTKPGMIRPYSYDPYGGTFTAGTPYESAPTKAAEGGLMGMNDGGYNPGQLDFTQRSEPVVRMASGGIAGYAGNEGSLVGGDAALEAYQQGRYKDARDLLGIAGMNAQDVVSKYGLSQADAATVAKNLGYTGDMSGIQYAAPPVGQTTNVQNLPVIPNNNVFNTPTVNPVDAEMLDYYDKNKNLFESKDYNKIASDMFVKDYKPEAFAQTMGWDQKAVADLYNQTYGGFDRATQEDLVNQKYKQQLGLTDAQLGQRYFGADMSTRESRLASSPFSNAYETYLEELASTGRRDAPAGTQFRAKAVYEPGAFDGRGVIKLYDTATGQHLTNAGFGSFDLLDKFGVDPASYKQAISQAYESSGKPTYLKDDYTRSLGYKPRDVAGATDAFIRTPLEKATVADLRYNPEKDANNRFSQDTRTNIDWLGSTQRLLMSKGLGVEEASNYLHQFIPVAGLVDWAAIQKSKDPVKAMMGTLNYLQSKGVTNLDPNTGPFSKIGQTRLDASGKRLPALYTGAESLRSLGLRGFASGGIASLAIGGDTKKALEDAYAAAQQSGNYGAVNDLVKTNQITAADVADTWQGFNTSGLAGLGVNLYTPPAAPTYTQYTPEQMGSFLSNPVNKDIDLGKAIKDTNADPAAVNRYIASLTSPFKGSTETTGGSGTLGIYNQMVNQYISPDEYYAAAIANDPKYGGWTKEMIQKGYNLDKGAYALTAQIEKDKIAADPVLGQDKQWVKFMDDNKYSIDDMAQAFGLSLKEVRDRYNAVKNAEKKVITPITNVTGTRTGINTGVNTGVIPGGYYGNDTGNSLTRTPGDITTNPDGTVTIQPNIPGRPTGGFPGMASVRDAYTAGGGSLGYIPYAPKTIEEFESKYNTLTGGSKQSYDYLMGKTPYDPTPFTKTGEIMKPYWESVGKIPAQENNRNKKYVYVDGKYKLNPDYVKPSYVLAGEKAAALTDQVKEPTESPGAGNKWVWNDGAQKWEAKSIEAANNTTTTGQNDGGGGGEANGGLMAMARGGMLQQFDLGGYSDGGRLLRGPGDGVSDSIPATIGNKRPARLADGEFVVPARIVSELGNGSTEAGARKLYAMMDRVQAARKGSIGKGKVAKNSRADKYLPA